jgi:hypothetical protein
VKGQKVRARNREEPGAACGHSQIHPHAETPRTPRRNEERGGQPEAIALTDARKAPDSRALPRRQACHSCAGLSPPKRLCRGQESRSSPPQGTQRGTEEISNGQFQNPRLACHLSFGTAAWCLSAPPLPVARTRAGSTRTLCGSGESLEVLQPSALHSDGILRYHCLNGDTF